MCNPILIQQTLIISVTYVLVRYLENVLVSESYRRRYALVSIYCGAVHARVKRELLSSAS